MADLHSDPHPDLAGYLLGGLEPAEESAFAEHLAGCDACRSELGELASLPGRLVDVPPAEPLPAGLEERTFRAIEAAAALAAPPQGRIVPITQAHKARRTRWLAAAAAALLVIGVGVGVLTSLRKSSPPPLATIHLIAANGGPSHGVATVRSTSNGLTIDMTVDGLPPSGSDQFYTCWLVGDGDTLAHPNRVSVGSFVVRHAGTVHVHWTTAADLRQFPHLGVTLEPKNGNPSHQGPKVLTGV
jgi:anti-sigma-K factor RskA